MKNSMTKESNSRNCQTTEADERSRFVAIEYWFADDVDDRYEVLNELEEHLRMNGYDYYLSVMPGYEGISVLLINEEQTGYIDTILKDRNINYRYL